MSRRSPRKKLRRRERLARADGRHDAMTLENQHKKAKASRVLSILDEIHGGPECQPPVILEIDGLLSADQRRAKERGDD